MFSEPGEKGDDDAFADQITRIKTPVIFGAEVMDTGDWAPFWPAEDRRADARTVNLGNDKVYRKYPLEINGQPSLAEITVSTAASPIWQI